MECKKSIGTEMRLINILILRKISELIGLPEADENVTFMHGRIVEFLYTNRQKEIFQRDIEQDFQIRRSTATKILQSMEKRGLITRQGVDYDARLKQVTLTEKGLLTKKRMIDMFNKFESDLAKDITEEELKIFFSVIEKIKRNIGEI